MANLFIVLLIEYASSIRSSIYTEHTHESYATIVGVRQAAP